MRRFFSFFLVFCLAVGAGLYFYTDPGYVLIVLHQWTVEMTLWVAVMIMTVFFLLLHLIFQFLIYLHSIPTRFKQWLHKRKVHKAQNNTRLGLIEFSEGHWAMAKNHLVKALPDSDAPLLNYLTAARAAQELGEHQLRDDFLREAQQAIPDAGLAVKLTQAQLQLAHQQWEQALATLKHLHQHAPRHPYVLKLLMHLYQEVRDWAQLILLLPELKKNNIISGFAYTKLAQHTYFQAMTDLIKLQQITALKSLFKNIPKALQYEPSLVHIYAQFLIQNKEEGEAELLLRTALQKNFQDTLVDLYGSFFINDKQMHFAESLLKKHANSAALLLCLGRFCLYKKLWGRSKEYLEQSLQVRPSFQAYQSLGDLLEILNQFDQARFAYKKGLHLLSPPYLNEPISDL